MPKRYALMAAGAQAGRRKRPGASAGFAHASARRFLKTGGPGVMRACSKPCVNTKRKPDMAPDPTRLQLQAASQT